MRFAKGCMGSLLIEGRLVFTGGVLDFDLSWDGEALRRVRTTGLIDILGWRNSSRALRIASHLYSLGVCL